MPRAVVFVVEDVLVPEHTGERWQWAWRPQGPLLPERAMRAALRRALHDWDRRRWASVVGESPPVDLEVYRAFLHATLEEVAGHPLAEAEASAVVDRFQRSPLPRVPFPEVPGVLATLRAAGHRIAALSERPGPQVEETLKRAGLRTMVDHVAGLAADAPWPPAREAFRAASEALGVPLKETALVGRLYWSEVRASQRSGLTGYLLDRPDWWPRVTERRMRALPELPALLSAPAAETVAPVSANVAAEGTEPSGAPNER